MIAITPEAFDSRFARSRIVDANAEAGVGISFWRARFVVSPMPQSRLEVVLANRTGNGAGVQSHVLAGDDALANEHAGELNANLLKNMVWTVAEKRAEAFEARRSLVGIESQRSRDRRIVPKQGMQIPQELHAPESLVDQRLQQAEPIDRSTTDPRRRLWPCGQELKKFLPAQARREMLGLNEFGLFHHVPEFCERWACSKENRGMHRRGLGRRSLSVAKCCEFRAEGFHKTPNSLNQGLDRGQKCPSAAQSSGNVEIWHS